MIRFPFKLLISFGCSLLLLLGSMKHAPAASSYEPLYTAMLATGAKVEEWNLHGWVKLSDPRLSDAQLEEMVEEAMGQLGMKPLDYQLIHQQENGRYLVQAEAISSAIHILIVAQIMAPGGKMDQTEGYLVINMEGKEDENISAQQLQEKIKTIIEKNGHSPQINTCLIGWLDGKLRDGEWRNSLQNALNITHARNVNQIETEHFVSCTGFTPEIAEWLQVDNQLINLNIAMHYSQYDGRTYVTIASPIITREY